MSAYKGPARRRCPLKLLGAGFTEQLRGAYPHRRRELALHQAAGKATARASYQQGPQQNKWPGPVRPVYTKPQRARRMKMRPCQHLK